LFIAVVDALAKLAARSGCCPLGTAAKAMSLMPSGVGIAALRTTGLHTVAIDETASRCPLPADWRIEDR
jgi:hypothetical protein